MGKRKTYVWHAVVTARSSISHGGESEGTTQRFRREKMVLPDGKVELIPVISGNAIRGQLRDNGALGLLRRLRDADPSLRLSRAAFALLFSGGALSKDAAKQVDLAELERLTGVMPFLSVFGGATGRNIIEGHLICGKMVPVAKETRHILPESVIPADGELPSVWDLMQTEDYTRRDDEKRRHLRRYMDGPVPTTLVVDDKKQKEQPTQMRYTYETMAAGTRLWWYVCLQDVGEVELGAFLDALISWCTVPHVGGRAGCGLGQLNVTLPDFVEITATVKATPDAEAALKAYDEHCQAKAQEIIAALKEVT